MFKKRLAMAGVVLTLVIGMTLSLGAIHAAAAPRYVFQGKYFYLSYTGSDRRCISIIRSLNYHHVATEFDTALYRAFAVLQMRPGQFTGRGRLQVNLRYWKDPGLEGVYHVKTRLIWLNIRLWNSRKVFDSVRRFAAVLSHEGSHAAFMRRIIGYRPYVKKGPDYTIGFFRESLAWYTQQWVVERDKDYNYNSLINNMRCFYQGIYEEKAGFGYPCWSEIYRAYQPNSNSKFASICRYYFVAFGWWLSSTRKVGKLLDSLKYEYAHYNGRSAFTHTFVNTISGETIVQYSRTVTERAFYRTYGMYANENYNMYMAYAKYDLHSFFLDFYYVLNRVEYYTHGYNTFVRYWNANIVPIPRYNLGYTGSRWTIEPSW